MSLEVTLRNTLPPVSASSPILLLKLAPPPSLPGLQVSLWMRHFEW